MTIDSVRKTVVRFIRRFFPPLDDLLRLKIGYRFVVGYRINESAGLSPVEAISSMTIGSSGEESVIYRHIERSIRERQTTLSEAIRRSGAFPDNLPEWLDPAERNARLGEEMGRIEMVYHEMIREKIEFFKGSIKPVTTILVGGLVLFGFAAMWIPLFGMIENLMTGGVAIQH
ncbi:type II secretion system F family protein [Leptospirillum ferriphilum]|nr:type II secretion system F family protein [Leptospirillum ferriphilum]